MEKKEILETVLMMAQLFNDKVRPRMNAAYKAKTGHDLGLENPPPIVDGRGGDTKICDNR